MSADTDEHPWRDRLLAISRRLLRQAGIATRDGARTARAQLVTTLGGAQRARVVTVLAAVLALNSADIATVGASASQLKESLHVSNAEIGLLVTATSLVVALASVPFGVLADRVRRTWTLGIAIAFWGACMVWSAFVGGYGELLLARLVLGAVTAAAGPLVASLVGDYFAGSERGRIYGFILSGELIGAGLGFVATGDVAALSWRAAFLILAFPAFALAWIVFRLPEPARGGASPYLPDVDDEPTDLPASTPSPPLTANDNGEPSGDDTKAHWTDAQTLAHERGVHPDPKLVLHSDAGRMPLVDAVRYVLQVRTNVVLIAASACGYFYLAGLQTFGLEFTRDQYGVSQFLAGPVLLFAGLGAVGGVLTGGALGDALLRRGRLNGRIVTSAVAAALAVVMFIPALLTHSVITAIPYLTAAGFFLAAQNPALDAARLDIMPPLLWGRAEAVRTVLRSLAQAVSPLLFGVFADYIFGGGTTGLQWTFGLMLVFLAAAAWLLFRARHTYPTDVATAAAAPPPL